LKRILNSKKAQNLLHDKQDCLSFFHHIVAQCIDISHDIIRKDRFIK
jgi:hypothetical protein